MKKFVAVILTSLVVLAIADRAVGALLEHLFRTTSSGAIGRQNELLQDDVPQVAVFGSSRALHHYVPSVIAETTGMTCRNYGLGGQGIFYHYVLMRTLTERKMPRVIVYELTYDYDVATSDPARELAALRLLPPSAVRDSMLRALDCWEAVRSLSRSYAYNTQPVLIMADRVQYKPTSDDRGYVAKHGQMEEGRAYSGRDFDTEHTSSLVWPPYSACSGCWRNTAARPGCWWLSRPSTERTGPTCLRPLPNCAASGRCRSST